MRKPAARQGDMHTCPASDGPKPHVGGPIINGNPTVLISGMPAAVIGGNASCIGPPDTLINGSRSVIIGGLGAVRMGDRTAHGGIVGVGSPSVLFGD